MEEEVKPKPKKTKRSVSNIHTWMMIPIMVGFIALLIFSVQWKSQLVVQRIIVDGAHLLQAKEVVALSAIPPQAFIEQIVPAEIERNLLTHPLIKYAKVSSQLPDAMIINVVEREPFAVLSGKTLLYVDSDGVLLPRLPSMQFDLPLVNGIEGIDSLRLGRQVPSDELMLALEVLKQSESVGWYHAISEIKVASNGDIMLFAMDSGVPIFVGRDDVANKLQRLQTFWKNYVKNGTASQLKYLDLRFDGQVVVKWDRANNQTTRIPL